MKFIIILCLIHVISGDYFWVDYDGTIPSTAFRGRNEIYIGVTFYQESNALLPSVILPQRQYVTSVLDKPLTSFYNTKILCSRDQNLLWIDSSIHTIDQNRISCTFIPGGFAKNQAIYIGGIEVGGEFHIGPVFYNGLTIINGSYVQTGIKQFQILGQCNRHE